MCVFFFTTAPSLLCFSGPFSCLFYLLQYEILFAREEENKIKVKQYCLFLSQGAVRSSWKSSKEPTVKNIVLALSNIQIFNWKVKLTIYKTAPIYWDTKRLTTLANENIMFLSFKDLNSKVGFYYSFNTHFFGSQYVSGTVLENGELHLQTSYAPDSKEFTAQWTVRGYVWRGAIQWTTPHHSYRAIQVRSWISIGPYSIRSK